MALGPGKATNEPANYFAFGVQTAVNAPQNSTFFYTKHLSGTGFDVASEFKAERIGGGGREVGLIYKNMIKADGQIVTYAYPEAAARLLTHALGKDTQVSASGPVGAPSTPYGLHKIVSGSATTLPYLTMQQKWADEEEYTSNCVVSELKIEGSQGAPIKMTTPFISGGTVSRATNTSLSPTREAGTPFMYPGASAALEVSSAELAVATTSELTKFSLTIKNTLDEGIQTLALTRTDAVWENSDYNLDGTVKYTDRNIWNQVNYYGGSNTSINLATGNFTFYARQSSNPSMSMLLSVPVLYFGSVKVNRLDPDGKTMFLDFSALTQATSGTNSIIAEITCPATGGAFTLSTV